MAGADRASKLPVILTAGCALRGDELVFFAPTCEVSFSRGQDLTTRLLPLLDGSKSVVEIECALMSPPAADSSFDALRELQSLGLVLPITRLYESWFEFNERIALHQLESIARPANSGGPARQRITCTDCSVQDQLPRLFSLLQSRRSRRRFAAGAIATPRLLGVLWAMYGSSRGGLTNDPAYGPDRSVDTVPSAGGFYSFELRVFVRRATGDLSKGTYLWDPCTNSLEPIEDGDGSSSGVSDWLPLALCDSLQATDPPIVVSLIGDLRRVTSKYGLKAYKFLCLEAGHILQNAYLAAAELGLAVVEVGTMDLAVAVPYMRLSRERLYFSSVLLGEHDDRPA